MRKGPGPMRVIDPRYVRSCVALGDGEYQGFYLSGCVFADPSKVEAG